MIYIEMPLPYTYEKDDDKNPESIRLETEGAFHKVHELEKNEPGIIFKRVTEYSNGLIVSETMTSGKHLFGFNKPFTIVKEGVLRF